MNAFARPHPARPCASPATPPAPPIGVPPQRFGNGRVELQIYPHATTTDRLAAAVTLLAGTGFRLVEATAIEATGTATAACCGAYAFDLGPGCERDGGCPHPERWGAARV